MISNTVLKFIRHSAIDDLSVLHRRRVVIATMVSLIGISASLIMVILAILKRDFILIAVDIAMASLLSFFLYRVKKTTELKRVMELGSLAMGCFGVFYFFYGQGDVNTHLWFYTYPLTAVSITGRKSGAIHFHLFLVILLIGTVGQHLIIDADTTFSVANFIRFVFSLYVVFTITTYIEQTSETEHDLLIAQNEELEKAKRDLEELTIRDPLTGLFNRRYLDEVLPLGISQSRRYKDEIAVMMIDVDFFKKYNDFYGHQKGDEALKIVAQAIESCVRRNTDYVCRYGGEEFAIVMNKCNAAAVDLIADNIIKTLHEKNEPHVYGVKGRITVSIGTATADQMVVDTEKTIIERADKALYEAKRLGRNRYCKM